MEFRLGNPARACVLCASDSDPRDDDRYAQFLDVNDAVFDLDAEGNKVVNNPEEDWSNKTWP